MDKPLPDPDYIGPYDPDTDGPPGDDHDCTGEGEDAVGNHRDREDHSG